MYYCVVLRRWLEETGRLSAGGEVDNLAMLGKRLKTRELRWRGGVETI